MIRMLIHYGIHFLVPVGIAVVFFPKIRWKALLVFWLAMLIDLDHLLADPLFDSARCSIGFHPLHTLPAILTYALLLFFPRLRLIGLALVLHVAADSTDCWLMDLGL